MPIAARAAHNDRDGADLYSVSYQLACDLIYKYKDHKRYEIQPDQLANVLNNKPNGSSPKLGSEYTEDAKL